MDTLPAELIHKILSFLPPIDRVKSELINWKFNCICKDLWLQQFSINENQLAPVKWTSEFQIIQPDPFDEERFDFMRWKLMLKCPRIEKIIVDDEKSNSKFFIERAPYIKHLTVRKCSTNFSILNNAKCLATVVFEKSDCNEYNVIQHLSDNIHSIEGPPLIDPWVDKWDEFFEHADSVRFQNLVKLTVVITLQTIQQFNNLLKLDRLTYIRFLVGDDFDNHLLVEYLNIRGSKLKGLELFQPVHHESSQNVYAAVIKNCIQLKQLGMKGYFHGKSDYDHFKTFLFHLQSMEEVSLNIPRVLTEEEVITLCSNNSNLRKLNFNYYMPSITTKKFKIWKRHCEQVKLIVENFNSRNPARREIIFDTSSVVKKISSELLAFK